MALDGICIHALTHEFQTVLSGARVRHIAQPEKNELLLTFHTANGQRRLLISANASLPLCYLTDENKPSPQTAPNFCMLLRKHIGNARLYDIEQFGLERVICFHFEHLDELGDPAKKRLYVELMGKYSNIIFCDDEDNIMDSIIHVGSLTSSVREVLPGKQYFIPAQNNRFDPFEVTPDLFYQKVLSRPQSVVKALSTSFIGFSKISAIELSYRAGIDSDLPMQALHEEDGKRLYKIFESFTNDIKSNTVYPSICYDNAHNPIEFASFSLTCYEDCETETNESMSYILEAFYKQKNKTQNIKGRSVDLRKIITTHLDRARRKEILQNKQIEDTKKKDKYRLYGELLHTYGYEAKPGDKEITVLNYHDNTMLTIPLDDTKSASDNAKAYFARYDKYKRTFDALMPQLEQTKASIHHLESILGALDIAESESDLEAIRKELHEFGYIKKRPQNKRKEKKQPPLCFETADHFLLYVGKNNYQNEEVTFKIATGNDWWFHAKKMPGSHVILKTDGREVPDHVFEIAASLAAYYSSGRDADKVEIDYVQKKQVKKTPGGAPGFVIYYTNYSMTVKPSIEDVQRV